jgi:hypothetical protein
MQQPMKDTLQDAHEVAGSSSTKVITNGHGANAQAAQ